MRHIFSVPTHRRIQDNALEGFFMELEYARQACGLEIPLIVLDDGTDNRQTLAAAASRHSSVPCFRLDLQDMDVVYDHLIKMLSERSRQAVALLRSAVRPNYGNAFNRLYLIAAMMGATHLHRRDSDVCPQYLARPDGSLAPLLPIELEVQYLGKVVDDRVVQFAGGGYTGMESLDVAHLSKDGDTGPLRRFYRLLSISDDICDAILRAESATERLPYGGDELVFDGFRTPHCGNLAIGPVFELLPSSPAPYALGTDYFAINCLNKLGFGRLTHNRDLAHEYVAERDDSHAKLVGYWRGIFGLVLYQQFYRPQQHMLFEQWGDQLAREGSLPAARDAVVESMQHCLSGWSFPDVQSTMDEFQALAALKSDPRMPPVLAELRSQQQPMFDSMRRAIDEHLALIAAWPEIVAAARDVRRAPEVDAIFTPLGPRRA